MIIIKVEFARFAWPIMYIKDYLLVNWFSAFNQDEENKIESANIILYKKDLMIHVGCWQSCSKYGFYIDLVTLLLYKFFGGLSLRKKINKITYLDHSLILLFWNFQRGKIRLSNSILRKKFSFRENFFLKITLCIVNPFLTLRKNNNRCHAIQIERIKQFSSLSQVWPVDHYHCSF